LAKALTEGFAAKEVIQTRRHWGASGAGVGVGPPPPPHAASRRAMMELRAAIRFNIVS
jgi:hypothetical protein